MDVKKHPYFVTGRCPCVMDEKTVTLAKAIYDSLPEKTPAAFALELDRQGISCKKIWYDEKENSIFIKKKYGKECGEYNENNKTKFGERCYCSHYNGITEGVYPLSCCKCGAEFYRPMFAPIYGEDVLIEPCETVLAGNETCVLAVRIGKTEKDYIAK